jgi:hypothetical protein
MLLPVDLVTELPALLHARIGGSCPVLFLLCLDAIREGEFREIIRSLQARP